MWATCSVLMPFYIYLCVYMNTRIVFKLTIRFHGLKGLSHYCDDLSSREHTSAHMFNPLCGLYEVEHVHIIGRSVIMY